MKKKILVGLLLLVYIIILFKILVLKEVPIVRVGHMLFNFGGTQNGPSNLIPFKSILPYLLGKNGFLIAILNIGGNIVLFIPIGLLLPIVFSKIRWIKILFIAFASGLCVENIQAILHIGIFDIDDVLLNGLGVIIGYWINNIFINLSIKTKKTITIIITALSVVLILFYLMAVSKKIELPFSLEHKIERRDVNKNQMESPYCCDPCNGTGGTGEIIAINNKSVTIIGRRNNGANQIIKITNQTIIKNASGPILISNLKVGDHITVVIDESETASLILLCGLPKPIPKH